MLKIKELCKTRGVTQKDLAQALEVPEVTIRRAARGNASIPMLQRIAATLGVKVSELFEEQPAPVIRCPHCGGKIDIVPKE